MMGFRKYIVTFILSVFSLAAYSQQLYNRYGEIIGRYESEKIYDRTGFYKGRQLADRFYDARGNYIGRYSNGRYCDKQGDYIGYLKDSKFYSGSGVYMGEIKREQVYDRFGYLLGRVRGAPEPFVGAVYFYILLSGKLQNGRKIRFIRAFGGMRQLPRALFL